MEVLSAFRGRGADRRCGLGASCGLKVRAETGRLSPPQSVTAFRLSSMVIRRCVPDYNNSISRDLEFLCLLRIIALETVHTQVLRVTMVFYEISAARNRSLSDFLERFSFILYDELTEWAARRLRKKQLRELLLTPTAAYY